ncbi:MAG: carboxy terminal-processing peptidase [Myxococcota bacterium]
MRLAPRTLAPLLLLLALPAGADAPVEAPTAASFPVQDHHRLVSHLVGSSLSGYHYAARPLTDDVSEAWLGKFLDDLDPLKLFFLKSDVDAFKVRERTLDDDIRRTQPDLNIALDVFTRYKQRAHEAYAFAASTLDEDMNFDTAGVSAVVNRDDAAWPADAKAREAVWRDRVRAQVLDQYLEGRTKEQAKETLGKRFDRGMKNLDQMETYDVVEIYLSSLASVFDPHSAFFAPTTSEDFDIRMRDALEGIGAELRMEDIYTKVVRLIPGGPAETGGDLSAGDLIVAVAQGNEEPVDVVDMRLDHVVQLIRGKKGSEVRLTVRPADASDPSQTEVVTIVRDRVVLERASAKAELKEVKGADGKSVKVGVIEVPSFYVDGWAARRGDKDARSTTNDVRKLIATMRAEGATSLMLDLRGNGGGALSEALSLTGLFIDEGPVVQVKDPQRGTEVLEDPIDGVAWAGPLVVLTDELSASASEIFAGAIQDYGRGLVVGSPQTHGKGTVQSMVDLGAILKDGALREHADKAGALKITVQKFYRVSGESTQLRGVVPDVVMPSPWQGLDVLESDLDGALPWDTVDQANYSALPLKVDLPQLQAASAARVASTPVFGWLAEDIAERKSRENNKSLSLHKATREGERKARKDKLDARAKLLGIERPDDDGKPDEDVEGEDKPDSLDGVLEAAILSEALAVTADFSAKWTPPAALLDADLGPKSAGSRGGRKGK